MDNDWSAKVVRRAIAIARWEVKALEVVVSPATCFLGTITFGSRLMKRGKGVSNAGEAN